MAKRKAYYDSWASLAAAIIRSGEVCNDQRFLESDWCDTLKYMCQLDDELHPGRTYSVNIIKGGKHAAQR